MRQTPLFFAKIIVFFGLAGLFLPIQTTAAQVNMAIQEVTGEIEPGAAIVYRVSDLVKGQTVYAYMAGISGNLDPLMVLVEGDADPINSNPACSNSLYRPACGCSYLKH